MPQHYLYGNLSHSLAGIKNMPLCMGIVFRRLQHSHWSAPDGVFDATGQIMLSHCGDTGCFRITHTHVLAGPKPCFPGTGMKIYLCGQLHPASLD